MFRIKFGTNRIVIVGGKWGYKIPLFRRGRMADANEYFNYLRNVDIVAETHKRWYGLKQRRLTDILIFPRNATLSDIPDNMKPLFARKLHNRFQVGRDEFGAWLFFDYEDIKYYLRGEDEQEITGGTT